MEKVNIVAVFKKGDKQLLQNYQLFFLLRITGKIFERLLYNQMFEFLLEMI